jgi:hypothetical protein
MDVVEAAKAGSSVKSSPQQEALQARLEQLAARTAGYRSAWLHTLDLVSMPTCYPSFRVPRRLGTRVPA